MSSSNPGGNSPPLRRKDKVDDMRLKSAEDTKPKPNKDDPEPKPKKGDRKLKRKHPIFGLREASSRGE